MTNRTFDGLTALGDPTRRAIFDCLAERPRAVGELADALPVSRPAVSQHLKVLKDVGLVSERREGTKRILSVRAEGLAELHDFLAEVLPTKLERLKEVVEKGERAERDGRRAKQN